MLFFWTLYSLNNPEKNDHSLAQLFSILIRKNVSWASDQQVRMIPEGSCDTEERLENSALYHRNNLHFLNILKTENSYFKK